MKKALKRKKKSQKKAKQARIAKQAFRQREAERREAWVDYHTTECMRQIATGELTLTPEDFGFEGEYGKDWGVIGNPPIDWED